MGERFGEYELIEKIAVGGMAELYKAKSVHGKGVEKIVVIKRIHPALSADKSFVAMFVDEARLGVSLVHGNIVPVFDFGHIDGHYYLAMEYVDGHDLTVLCGRAKIVKHPWPVDLAIHLVKEVLRGLEYAHNKRDINNRPLKLVHRDISPSNILVSTDGEVKILDFGIAHSMSREFETRTGVVKGKPGYMSPEQAAGQPVDRRSDIWSTGAILYELLTGLRLKDGRQRLDDPDLDPILDRSLAADPDNRFESAADLSAALDDILRQRELRPTSATLANYSAEVMRASSPSEDWTMSSEDAGHHMAAALKMPSEAPLPTTRLISDKQTTAQYPPEFAGTVQIGDQNKKRWTRPARIAAFTALLATLLSIGWWTFELPGLRAPVEPPATTAPAAPPTGKIKISCQPAGAAISVDGKATGKQCPNTLELAAGPHAFTLSLSGYESRTFHEEIDAASTLRMQMVMESSSPTLSITSDPPGAQVAVDGSPRGTSPLTDLEIPVGDHVVQLTLEGHKPWEQAISSADGEHIDLAATLEKPAPRKVVVRPEAKAEPSFISINTRPWAVVRIDGQVAGNTPLMSHPITPGKHRIVLSNPVRQLSKTFNIVVKPGEHKKIKEFLDEGVQ